MAGQVVLILAGEVVVRVDLGLMGQVALVVLVALVRRPLFLDRQLHMQVVEVVLEIVGEQHLTAGEQAQPAPTTASRPALPPYARRPIP